MLKDITLGQYYQTDSVLHRLDPRVKLAGTFLYILSLFIVADARGYVVAFVFLALCVGLSQVPLRFIFRGMRSIYFLLALTITFNLFLTPGEEIWRFHFLAITREGARTASLMGIRLIFLITGSSLMTFTTTPNQLTDGLERLLRPLRLFHVPVHEIAMMMSIALRFIPILMEETDKIMKAQIARGADFESGSIMQRARALVPLLVPLFISAFRRANDLALAMEARCYHGGEGRTKMKPLKYAGRDLGAYGILAGYLLCCIVLGRWIG
ncbi:MAG: energy-coupling factor transporter transmembrane protein EcfT [Butyrivibrio sp.]|nr:energy-coupling factor transporter transmembrane protein EcfT [Butyrivibrio sp.]